MTKSFNFNFKSNTLTRAVLASTLFIATLSAFSHSASAAVLVINGSDQLNCPLLTCGAQGVEFQTDNTLFVQSGQNIGQAGGVSVSVTGGNNIGEILFKGTNSIAGSVSLMGNILRLITLDSPGIVTALSDVRVTTLSLEGPLSTFALASGNDLTAQVNGSSINTVILQLQGTNNVIGNIGSLAGPVQVNLSPLIAGGGGVVNTTGNIVGPVQFLNGSNQELTIADNKTITGTVTTAVNNTGTLTFQGSSATAGDIGQPLFQLNQVNIKAGNFIVNHNIFASPTIVSECANVLINNNVTISALENFGTIQLGTLLTPRTLTVGTYNPLSLITTHPMAKLNFIVTNGGATYSKLIGTGAQIRLLDTEVNLLVTGNTIPSNTILTNMITSPNLLIVDSNFILSNLIIPSTATYQFTSIYTGFNTVSVQIATTPINSYFFSNPLLSTIAQFFDTIGPNIQTTAPGLVPLYDALNAQPNAVALQSAVASLGLPVNGNLLAVSRGGTTRGFNIISERMDNNRAEFARGETRYKYANFREFCDQIPCDYSMHSGQWFEFFGSALDQEDHLDTTGSGYRGRAWTLIAGYDKAFYPSLNAGAAFAYSQMQTDSSGHINNQLTADSYQGYLYASHERCDGYYWDGIVSLAYNDYDQNRDIDVASGIPPLSNNPNCIDLSPLGFIERAHSRFGGWQFNSYLEGGYQFRCKKFVVIPHGIWKTTYLRTNEFSEMGAPFAGFKNIQYDDMQEFEVGLGVKVAKNYICCKQYKFTPYIKLVAMHDFKNTPQKGISEFIAGGPSLFTTGFERDADSLTTSLGLTLNRKDNTFLTVEYDFEKRNDFSVYAAFLKYRVEWC